MSPAPPSPPERWEQLQQPPHHSLPAPRLRLLLAALDMNWRVEEPVYLRPRWGDAGSRVYHFILHRAGAAPRLVTVPEEHAVEAFLQANNLRVVVHES